MNWIDTAIWGTAALAGTIFFGTVSKSEEMLDVNCASCLTIYPVPTKDANWPPLPRPRPSDIVSEVHKSVCIVTIQDGAMMLIDHCEPYLRKNNDASRR